MPVPVVVLAGHDLQAGGSAKRLGIGVGEAESGFGQLIDVGRLVVRAPVASETFDPNVIGHDEDDIFWSVRRPRLECRQ